MSLRSRLKRLQKDLVGELDSLEFPDGSRHYFKPSDARRDVFMSEMAVGKAAYGGEEAVEFSPLIKAVANATEESREKFIRTYKCPFTGWATAHRDRSVTLCWAELDGTIRTEFLEPEEAEGWRQAEHDQSPP